jgi:RimJ/RimL family protein N-acetyltransferase
MATSFPEQIETERLTLRWVTESDANEIFVRYAQDPEVTRYLVWRPHQSIADTTEFIREMIGARAEGKRFLWLIRLRETGQVMGAVGLRPEAHIAWLGYCLARNSWGRGFATEASRAVVEAALAIDAIWRVQATCAIENAASARVLVKVGMKFEGILRCHILLPNLSDNPIDVRIYARVRDS